MAAAAAVAVDKIHKYGGGVGRQADYARRLNRIVKDGTALCSHAIQADVKTHSPIAKGEWPKRVQQIPGFYGGDGMDQDYIKDAVKEYARTKAGYFVWALYDENDVVLHAWALTNDVVMPKTGEKVRNIHMICARQGSGKGKKLHEFIKNDAKTANMRMVLAAANWGLAQAYQRWGYKVDFNPTDPEGVALYKFAHGADPIELNDPVQDGDVEQDDDGYFLGYPPLIGMRRSMTPPQQGTRANPSVLNSPVTRRRERRTAKKTVRQTRKRRRDNLKHSGFILKKAVRRARK